MFKKVKNTGQVINTRWVIAEKFKEGKVIRKTRLVARGFGEPSKNM